MKKLLQLFLFLCSFYSIADGQFIFQKTYGGAGNENIFSVKPTSDGGFIFTGNTTSYGTLGGEARDFFTIKTNNIGNVLWSRTVGQNDRREEWRSVIEVSTLGGGGYLYTGIQTPTAPPTFSDQATVQKVDVNGNQTWITFNGGAFDDEYSKTIEIPGIGYAHTGLTDAFGGASANIYLVTTNYTGGILGTRVLSSGGLDNGKDIRQTSDGGFIVGGLTNGLGGGGLDMVLVKYDALLNVSWYRVVGGAGNEECFSVRQTSDGGYIMAGYTTSFGSGNQDIMVLKFNNAGTFQWGRAIGGPNNDFGWAIRETSDGGFLVSGYTDSYGQPGQNGLLVKMTSAGAFSWAKTYGGNGTDQLWESEIRPGNVGFVAAGTTNSFGAGGFDAYLVVTDNNGNCGCNEQNVTPTFTTISPPIVTTGMVSGSGSNPTVVALTTNSPSPSLACQCTDYNPKREIIGPTQVCRNQTGLTYRIDSIPGVPDYTWTVNGTPTATNPGDTSITINAGSTNLQIIVTANWSNCSNINLDTINVTVDLITANITTADSLLCIGDATTLNASASNNQGAVTYSWTPAGTGASINVSPGTTTNYTVTATDSWGCTATDVIPVTVFNYPVVNLGNDTTYCDVPSVILNAGNTGATFLWSTAASSQTISVSTSNTYWVNVTVNGCTTRDSIDLVFGVSPNITFTTDDSLCIGENTNITANPTTGTGPFTYLWNSGLGTNQTINVSPSVDTYYVVTVSENTGCNSIDSVFIQVFGYPIVNLGNDSLYCDVAAVPLNGGNPGGQYLWSTSQTTQIINVNSSGTYWVDVTVNGCTTRDSIDLLLGVSPVVSINGNDTTCLGDTEVLTANHSGGSGPFLYDWANGVGITQSVNVSPLSNTTYTVTVTETNGCTGTATLLVEVFPYPTVNLGNDTLQCGSAGPVTLDAMNPGATYQWSTSASTQTINVNTTNTYWVDVTINTCTTRDSIFVGYSTNPIVTISGDSSICNGETTTLTSNPTGGTAPYSYIWTSGGTNSSELVSPNTNSNYTVTVTDVVGCTGTSSVLVEVTNYPIVNLGNDTIICDGNPLLLDAGNPGFNFLWQDASTLQTFSASVSGIYWVDVTNNNCTSRDSINVTFDVLPIVNLGPDLWICENENITLSATNTNATYLWSTNSTSDQITINSEGLYWVQVNKCYISVYDSIIISLDTFSIVIDSIIVPYCGGNGGSISVLPNGGVSGYTYTWSGSSETTPTLSGLSEGLYTVTVTDSEGCTSSLSIDLSCTIADIIVNQLVTPNNDGKNDTWVIENIINYPNNIVTIFNRWGNEVFNITNYQNDWSGLSNSSLSIGGSILPSGTYFYIIDLDGNGENIRSGYLELQQ